LPVFLHAEASMLNIVIGPDVGSAGEREFRSQTTGRFSKIGGNYRAITFSVRGGGPGIDGRGHRRRERSFARVFSSVAKCATSGNKAIG
jgi:hypothetical protein